MTLGYDPKVSVIGGKVVVDGLALSECELVTVLTQKAEAAVRLSLEEEAELLEAIAAEEMFGRLRRAGRQ